MESVKKLMVVVGLLVLCACATATNDQGTAAAAAKGNCDNVRCAACPDGQTPALKPPNCCACVPVDTSIKDCSNVRCAACPEGQHPALTPPNCCRCVAG